MSPVVVDQSPIMPVHSPIARLQQSFKPADDTPSSILETRSGSSLFSSLSNLCAHTHIFYLFYLSLPQKSTSMALRPHSPLLGLQNVTIVTPRLPPSGGETQKATQFATPAVSLFSVSSLSLRPWLGSVSIWGWHDHCGCDTRVRSRPHAILPRHLIHMHIAWVR
jgi:hypothetical protein